MEPASQLTPEALLAHAGWMRALARGLLSNPADADDVAQDAALAALRHPPCSPVSADAWLARIVRHIAWRRLRGDARRAEREERAARAESVLSHAETLERLDLQGALLEAVRELDEPYRTTIVQRYFEGRSSAAIARAAGVPAGTVRWRLKHGLDALRARLDQRFGKRDAWCVLLLPIAWPSGTSNPSAGGPATAASPVIQGVLAMSLAKLALSAAAVATVTGLVLWSRQRSSTREEILPGAPAAAVELEDALSPDGAAVAAVRTPAASRTEIEPVEPVEPVASAPMPPDEPVSTRVDVRFVDERGVPWPDVRFQALDPAREGQADAGGAVTTSDVQGRAALEVRFPGFVPEEHGVRRWRFHFLASRTGCATRKLAALLSNDAPGHIGDVVLVPGVRVSGRVLDGEERPIAGALVGCAPPELPAGETLLRRRGCAAFDSDLAARASADGHFVLDGVAPGPWRLWGHAPGMRYAWTDVLAVQAEHDLNGVELRLAPLMPGDRIAGRVLEPSGAPAPHASLESLARRGEHASYEWLQADALGRFEFVLGGDCETLDLTARDSLRSATASITGIVPGTLDLELRLVEPRSLLVRVRDGDGRPVEEASFGLSHGASGEGLTPQLVAAGSYRLTCPAIAIDHLEISAPGFIEARRGPWRSEELPAELEVVLQRSVRVRGRVVADGLAQAGAMVELREHYPAGNVLVNGLRCDQSTFPRSRAVTDGQGRFELDGDPGVAYVVRATAQGRAPGEVGPLEAGLSQELELELTDGGVLEGHVLAAADEEGAVVVANHGDGEARTQRTGPGGHFRFENLAPGRWQVLAWGEEIDPHSTSYGPYRGQEPIEWSCTVEVGRTTRFDLDRSAR